MDKEQIKDLLIKYKANACTEEELAILESWYLNFEYKDFSDLTDEEKEDDLKLIWVNIPNRKKSERIIWRYLSAAAVVLIALSAGLFFYEYHQIGETNIARVASDVEPGGNKAILTLANGERVSLTDAPDGTVMQNAGQFMIVKDTDGKLVYKVKSSDIIEHGVSGYNVLETPIGGQYQVALPDGTNVWLNAASSIKFPTSFAGQSYREVELVGEGYFEVKRDKQQPFKVITATQVVEVLGTHFNINAYKDESTVKTTLIEGRVKVNGALLKPGEQSTVSAAGINVEMVDVEIAMAWKNGLFMFDNENLESVMRKISKWYGVQVVYTDEALKDVVFGGTVSKFDHVSKVLRKLELTGKVHFKIEDKNITVMP